MIRKFLDFLFTPFITLAVLLDDSKRYDESWQQYHAKRNRKK